MLRVLQRAIALALVAGAAASVATGCGTGAETFCPVAASCGGDPTGSWTLQGKCEYAPVLPYQPLSLPEYQKRPQDPTINPPPPTPTTSGDWCSGLVYNPPDPMNPQGSVASVVPWHDAPPLSGGTLTLAAPTATSVASYTVSLTFSSTKLSTTHFGPACLQANGFTPTCQQLSDGLDTFFTNAAASMVGSTPAYSAFNCTTATDQGCDCSYSYEVVVSDQGAWVKSGDNLLVMKSSIVQYQYNGAQATTVEPVQPMKATYCVNGTLTMTGYQGASLFEAIGLRTMVFSKM